VSPLIMMLSKDHQCKECVDLYRLATTEGWSALRPMTFIAKPDEKMHCAWCGETDRVMHCRSYYHYGPHYDFCNGDDLDSDCRQRYTHFRYRNCECERSGSANITYTCTRVAGGIPYCFTGRNPNSPLETPLTCDYCGKASDRTVAFNPMMPEKFECNTFCTNNKNKCIKAYIRTHPTTVNSPTPTNFRQLLVNESYTAYLQDITERVYREKPKSGSTDDVLFEALDGLCYHHRKRLSANNVTLKYGTIKTPFQVWDKYDENFAANTSMWVPPPIKIGNVITSYVYREENLWACKECEEPPYTPDPPRSLYSLAWLWSKYYSPAEDFVRESKVEQIVAYMRAYHIDGFFYGAEGEGGEKFVQTLTDTAQKFDATPREMLIACHNCLSGHAKKRWKGWTPPESQLPVPVTPEYAVTLLGKFTQHFDNANKILSKEELERVRIRKYQQGETYTEYCRAKIELCQTIDPRMPEAIVVWHIVKGLPQEKQDELQTRRRLLPACTNAIGVVCQRWDRVELQKRESGLEVLDPDPIMILFDGK
jgi:hypothetical protein